MMEKYKTIKTNDLYNENNWDKIVKECGGWNKKNKRQNENINLKNCPFYQKRWTYVSQSGEEGILEDILKKIGMKNKFCIELGANNGKSISNTYYLKKKYNYTRLLIEGDKNVKISRDCSDEKLYYYLINSKNINIILENVLENPDLLSIDIDGDDYWVLKEMKLKPRIIILEYNPGLPNNIPLVCKEGFGTVKSYEGSRWNIRVNKKNIKQDPNTFNKNLRLLNNYYGANLLAYNRLMNKKGYLFVTSISDNLIYILKEEFDKLNINVITEENIIKKYFCPNKYWGEMHRDLYNNEWLIIE
mgnify:CR=1 FL=1